MKEITEQFKKLSAITLNRISVDEFKETEKTPIIVILDNVRSALNVGSAFRTSDAFLVQSIALCGITAQPPHREIQKTAIGATKSVHWQHFESTIDAVKYYQKEGYKVLAIEQAEDSLALQKTKFSPQEKVAVVFGNEVKGVDQNVMNIVDGTLEIPQFGTKHSFNISVSMGIVLWELAKQIRPDLID
jgi:23S rRNA (guanosine2251-2'-O)-methyltransferase